MGMPHIFKKSGKCGKSGKLSVFGIGMTKLAVDCTFGSPTLISQISFKSHRNLSITSFNITRIRKVPRGLLTDFSRAYITHNLIWVILRMVKAQMRFFVIGNDSSP